MSKKEKPGAQPKNAKESHSMVPKLVLAACPDGHETEFAVAPKLAQEGSMTGETCVANASFGSGPCGKELKVKQVLGQ